jgi:hypothetical protein
MSVANFLAQWRADCGDSSEHGVNWELFGWGGFQIGFKIFVSLGFVIFLMLSGIFLLGLLAPPVTDLSGLLVSVPLVILRCLMVLGVGFFVFAWTLGCGSSMGCQLHGGRDSGAWIPFFWFLGLTVLVLSAGSWRRLSLITKYESVMRQKRRLKRRLNDGLAQLERRDQFKIHEAVSSHLAVHRRSNEGDILECIEGVLPSSLNFEQAAGQANEEFQKLLQSGDIVLMPGAKRWGRRGPSYYQRGEAK